MCNNSGNDRFVVIDTCIFDIRSESPATPTNINPGRTNHGKSEIQKKNVSYRLQIHDTPYYNHMAMKYHFVYKLIFRPHILQYQYNLHIFY